MTKKIKEAVEEVSNDTESPLIIKNDKGQVLGEYTPQLVDTIKSTVAKGATDEELYMFLQVSSMYDLNPFLKEIWFTKMRNKSNGKEEVAIMTSRDGYMKLAKKNPAFKKCQSVAVYENDEFSMEFDMGDVAGVSHKFKQNDRGKLVGAYAVLSTYGNETLVSYVEFKEYRQNTKSWSAYPSAMIRKVAENDVYKRFAGISGLCAVEDMPHRYLTDAEAKEVTDFEVIDAKVVE